MDDELEQDEPKISLVVGILATILFVILDLLSLIPGVGDLEAILGMLGMAISFVSNAGGTLLTVLGIANFIKLIPFLQEVPAWTPGWLFVWYAENHPSAATNIALEAAQTESSLERGGEGAGAMGEATKTAEGVGKEGAAATEMGDAGRVGEVGGGAQETTMGTGEAISETGETATATGEAEAQITENVGETGEAKETSGEGETPEGESQTKEGADLTPKEERNPLEVAGEELDNPSGDFGSWDNGGTGNNNEEKEEEDEDENRDDELPMAA